MGFGARSRHGRTNFSYALHHVRLYCHLQVLWCGAAMLQQALLVFCLLHLTAAGNLPSPQYRHHCTHGRLYTGGRSAHSMLPR